MMTKAELMYRAQRHFNEWEDVLDRVISDNFSVQISCKYEIEWNHDWDFSIRFIWIDDEWAPSLEQLQVLWDFGFKSLFVLRNDMSSAWYRPND